MARSKSAPDESTACQLQFDLPSAIVGGREPHGDSTVEVRFFQWLKQNDANDSDVWNCLFVKPAIYEAEHDRRVSVQRLIEQARAKDRVNWVGQEVKINNSFAPLIARKLVHDYPQLRGHVELRRSNYDHLLGDGEE